ncbi:MAG: tetratricopeptide repeat protein [Planctomycetes bacterium]|nr:tetratricopeptide repeat protein [Planctomycetota bacterium]
MSGDVTAESFSSRKVCLARAREHLNARAYRAAANTLSRGVRQWPQLQFEHEYLTAAGHVAWRQGMARHACGLLRLAARQDGCHVEARFTLGRVLLDAGRPEEAARVLADVLNDEQGLVPWRVHAGGALSVAYAELGLNRSSQDALEKAASFGLISAQLLADEGYRLMRIGAYAEAEVQLAKGLQVDSTCEDAFSRLARVLYIQGKHEPAMEVLAYGIEQSPEAPAFYALMADIYQARSQYREAAAFLKRALEVAPEADDRAQQYLLLARCMHAAGKPDAAVAVLQELLERHKRAFGLRRIAEDHVAALKARTDAAKAVRLANFPRKLQKRNFCAPNTLANVLTYLGRPTSQEQAAAEVMQSGSSHWPAVLEFLRKQEGLAVRAFFGSPELVRKCLDAGLPVITHEYWGLAGHAIALVGYDEAAGHAVAQDPARLQPVEITWRELQAGWAHDDGLCVAAVGNEKKKLLPGVSGDEEQFIRRYVELLALRSAGKLDDALRLAAELADQAPEKQAPSRVIAELLLEMRQFEGARKVCEESVTKWPRSFHARLLLGQALWRSGEVQGAMAQFRAARRLDRDDEHTLLAMGELCLQQGRSRLGRACLALALRRAPHLAAARLLLGEELLRAGEKAAAASHARLLVEYDPDHVAARELLARIEGDTTVRKLADSSRRANEAIQEHQERAQAAPAPESDDEEDEFELDVDD